MVHNPPCRTGPEHMNREIDAGDADNESLDGFVSRFIAERETEQKASDEVSTEMCAWPEVADWAPGELVGVYGK